MNKTSDTNDTTWFIFTGGNRFADCMISDTGQIGPEDECPDMVCSDGQTRNLIRCPNHGFVAVFEEAAKAIAPVNYKIFRKVGREGKIEERPAFMDPRSRSKSSAATVRNARARVPAAARKKDIPCAA